jgi:hypothetical protein
MTFPDPTQQPDAFIAYLEARNLDCCLAIFQQHQSRPGDVSDAQSDEASATKWCKEMDIVLVCILHCSLSHAYYSTKFTGETRPQESWAV